MTQFPAIRADQKRALSDLSCATRKLVELFRSRGAHDLAAELEASFANAREEMAACRTYDAENGTAR